MRKYNSIGFSLIELLVVVVILGIMVMIIGSTFTTSSDIARVRTATRGVMQMSRYARTMAVLYQTPVFLVIDEDGVLGIERSGNEAAKGQSDSVVVEPSTATKSQGDESALSVEFSGGGSYIMAELEAEKSYVQVRFKVDLDEVYYEREELERKGLFVAQDLEKESAEMGLSEQLSRVKILYESNGRCLPYKVTVMAAGEGDQVSMVVTVDRFGVPKVKDEGL